MQLALARAPGVSPARPEPVAAQVLPEGDGEGRVAAYHMVVKRSHRFGDDGALRPAPARPLEFADRWLDGGDASNAAPAAVSELCPPRPRCDVVVMGHCHPPGGRATECVCAVAIGGVEHRVRVVGDRTAWLPAGARRARFTPPRPFAVMPLDWSRAWGGRDDFDPTRRALASNPVGRGFWVEATPAEVPEAWRARAGAVALPLGAARRVDRYGPLPNLLPESGWPGPDDVLRPDGMGDDSGDGIGPVAFGWRAAHWAPEGRPSMASARHGQAPPGRGRNRAPAALQVPHPVGGAELVLTHMRAGVPRLALTLPRAWPAVYFNAGFGRAVVHMVLDTVLVEPDAGRLDLVWRGTLPMPAGRRPTTVMPRLLEVDGAFCRWAAPFDAPIPPEALYGPGPAEAGGEVSR